MAVLRDRTARTVALCAVVLAVCLPGVAFGSTEASSVITVPGSVVTVTGPVSLDATTIAALAAVMPSSSVATVTLSAVDAEFRDAQMVATLLGLFGLWLIVGVKAVGR